MKLKDLIKELKEYDKNTEIKVWYIDTKDDAYVEREMERPDIMVSKCDGKTTIIFYPLLLN